MGVPEGGLDEIQAMVAAATLKCEYFRRERGYALFRRRSFGGLERLVDGDWVPVRQPRSFLASGEWESLENDELALHVRRYLLANLMGEPLGWRTDPRGRLRRSSIGRWVAPPLKAGAGRRLAGGAANRSRLAYAELLEGTENRELAELREQAQIGYEHQRERSVETERRANFFLVTAGLTTSVVLANAGLLLGAGKLDAPWRALAAVALAAASVCAVAAGLRAMQAMMVSFFRTPPNAVDRIFDRRSLVGDTLTRAYVAALFVAQGRAGTIGDWKINRLRDARRWFLGAIAGVVLLTGCVLADATWAG